MINNIEEFKYVEDFFNKNPQEYEKIKNIFKQIIVKLANNAQNHDSFCHFFATPTNMPQVILKSLNMSESQLANGFYKIGFAKQNNMQTDSYYHVLSLLYYIANNKNDKDMRLFCITLMYVKLYNGRLTKYFPQGCVKDIASYVVNNMLRASHSFRKFNTPFHLVIEYLAPSLDETYANSIKNNPFDPRNGLIKLLTQAWARLDQIFVGIKNHYYEAHSEGKQLSVNSSNKDQDESVENFSGVIDRLSDKIIRTLQLKELTFNDDQKSELIKNGVSNLAITKLEELFNNEDYYDDMKTINELLMTYFNLIDETKVCQMHVLYNSQKATSVMSDKHIMEYKKYMDSYLNKLFPQLTGSTSNMFKLRNYFTTIVLYRMKLALCKDARL